MQHAGKNSCCRESITGIKYSTCTCIHFTIYADHTPVVLCRSKLWNKEHGEVEEALKRVLKDLQLEYLDLYLVHWCALIFLMEHHSYFDFLFNGSAAWFSCSRSSWSTSTVTWRCSFLLLGFLDHVVHVLAHHIGRRSRYCACRPVSMNEGPKVDPSPVDTWKQMEAQVRLCRCRLCTIAHLGSSGER